MMLRQSEADPIERREMDERLDQVNRHHRWFGVFWLVLVIALAGAAWYMYPRFQQERTKLSQLADAMRTAGDEVKQTAAKLETQAGDQQKLRSDVTQLSRSVQAKLETATRQMRDSSADLYARIQTQVDNRIKGVESRVARIEGSSETQQTEIASMQRDLGQVHNELAGQAAELASVRQQLEQNGADHERQMAGLKQTEESDRRDVDSIAQKLAVRKVEFEVTRNHTRELADGVSLDVTGTDPAHRAVSGWLWVMPDRRTIWLKHENAQTPVVFYGVRDGKKRELVITNVSGNSVTGYLLLPVDGTMAASPSAAE